MSLPPIKRLRKGVVLFLFLLAVFILYRLFFFKTEPQAVDAEPELPKIKTQFCLLVSSNFPINVDSVFVLGENLSKIYAYTSWDSLFKRTDTIFHTWYSGKKKIKRIHCKAENFSCYSSISADSLQVGFWSVDTEQKGILLNSKQFRITE